MRPRGETSTAVYKIKMFTEQTLAAEVDDGDEQEADVDTAGSEERSSTDEDVDSEASEKVGHCYYSHRWESSLQ